MSRPYSRLAPLAAVLSVAAPAAHATTDTRTFFVTAQDFVAQDGSATVSPTQNFEATVTATWDPNATSASIVSASGSNSLGLGTQAGFAPAGPYSPDYLVLATQVYDGFAYYNDKGFGFFVGNPGSPDPSVSNVTFYANNKVFTSVGTSSVIPGTLTVNNGTPEPSAWALMLAGFGLVGAAVRANRRDAIAQP